MRGVPAHRTHRRNLLHLVCLVSLIGCSLQSESQRPQPAFERTGQDAEFTVYSQKSNNSSTIAKPLRIVIYDFPTLSQFPLIDLDVDFSSQMVLLAAMGPASSEQCSIHIDRVWRDGEHLRVEVSEHYPDPDAQRHPRAASPYHAVVVGRCELPIDGFTSRIPHGAFLR